MSQNIFQQFVDWIRSFFEEEYELTVWYVYETTQGMGDIKVTKRKEKTYTITKIHRKNNYHIKADLKDGGSLEIKTVTPFDYEIRKLR